MRFGRVSLAALATTSRGLVCSRLFSFAAAKSTGTQTAFLPPCRQQPSVNKSKFLVPRNLSSEATENASRMVSRSRIALLQFKVTSDKETNHKTATSFVERAVESGAKMVVLPEIWNSPYATSAFGDYAEALPEINQEDMAGAPSAQLLVKLATQHNLWIIGGSIPEVDNAKLYNTCLVVSPEGNIVAKHRKIHLFDVNVPGGIQFRESDTLNAGSSVTYFDGGEDFGMVGVGICYDIRFPEYAMILAQEHNCKLLVYPGAFNLTTGPAHWELLIRARAVDNQCFVVMASPARSDPPEEAGQYPHYTAWGHSTVCAPWGDIVATTDEKESLVLADLNFDLVENMRQAIPCGNQKRHDLYKVQEVKDA